jgi:hypothetical protein
MGLGALLFLLEISKVDARIGAIGDYVVDVGGGAPISLPSFLGAFSAAVGAMVLVAATACTVYWNYERRRKQEHIRMLLNEYLPVDDNNEDSGYGPLADEAVDGRITGC